MKMYMLKFFLPNKTHCYGCMVYEKYEEAYTEGMRCLMVLEENSNFEVIKIEEVRNEMQSM